MPRLSSVATHREERDDIVASEPHRWASCCRFRAARWAPSQRKAALARAQAKRAE